MQVAILFFLIASFVGAHARLVQINSENVIKPRLFFKQIVEASGILPLEINVPDTFSAIMSGMNYMYQTASSYFSGGNEGGDQSQMQEVAFDEVDENKRPINGKHRKKKVKKLKKKTSASDDDDDMNVFDLLSFLMF
jgi:hypothetical protein